MLHLHIRFLTHASCALLSRTRQKLVCGPVAQPGRASALQAGGLGFESRRVHITITNFHKNMWAVPLPNVVRDRGGKYQIIFDETKKIDGL